MLDDDRVRDDDKTGVELRCVDVMGKCRALVGRFVGGFLLDDRVYILRSDVCREGIISGLSNIIIVNNLL
jgi:hypothetical protein